MRRSFCLLVLAGVLLGRSVGGGNVPTVYVAHRVSDRRPPYPCEDGRLVKVHLLRSGKIRFNNEEFDREKLGSRIDEIFKTRAVWLLFLGADPKVPLQVLADTVTVAAEHADYLALITPSVENLSGCLTVSLPVNFKEHIR